MSSTAVTKKNRTILGTAVRIILGNGNRPLAPEDIAVRGVQTGSLRIPRGRTRGYLSQLLQSTLYDDAHYAKWPLVRRVATGLYKAKARAIGR